MISNAEIELLNQSHLSAAHCLECGAIWVRSRDEGSDTCGECGNELYPVARAVRPGLLRLGDGYQARVEDRGKPGRSWFKPEREEHRNSALMTACYRAGLSAEQALDEAARHLAAQGEQLNRLLALEVRPMVFHLSAEEQANLPEQLRAAKKGDQ